MSQQQKPKSAIQPIQDVLDKGVELGVPKDAVNPDVKVDLSQGRAFPANRGRKGGMKKSDARLNMHPENDTIKYRKGPDDNKKYKGREDLFANQE